MGTICILLLATFIIGCGINSTTAEKTAQDFVKYRVKFIGFSNQTNTSKSVANYTSELVSKNFRKGMWEVTYLVYAHVDNVTKEKNVTVCIDSNGEVKKFNAKNQPCVE